jgi:hypothetical protein
MNACQRRTQVFCFYERFNSTSMLQSNDPETREGEAGVDRRRRDNARTRPQLIRKISGENPIDARSHTLLAGTTRVHTWQQPLRTNSMHDRYTPVIAACAISMGSNRCSGSCLWGAVLVLAASRLPVWAAGERQSRT